MASPRDLLGIRLARTLWGRWRSMPPPERERLRELAESAKEAALEVRGTSGRDPAAQELHAANGTLAAARAELRIGRRGLDDRGGQGLVGRVQVLLGGIAVR